MQCGLFTATTETTASSDKFHGAVQEPIILRSIAKKKLLGDIAWCEQDLGPMWSG
jgi:hypothetical protein